jgi:hypothetical protein
MWAKYQDAVEAAQEAREGAAAARGENQVLRAELDQGRKARQ